MKQEKKIFLGISQDPEGNLTLTRRWKLGLSQIPTSVVKVPVKTRNSMCYRLQDSEL